MVDSWISAETEAKEADFRGILNMHMSIAKAIIARQSGLPYLYVDLYAGPGRLVFRGKEFDGSPLILTDTAKQLGLETVSAYYEQDQEVADRLKGALASAGATGHFEVHPERCEVGFPKLLARTGIQRGRYGLVYSDPIRDEIPHALLNAAAERFPRVDLLSYVSATQYKRRRGVDDARPYLADHIAAVNKKVVLIREPIGMWQWTFVLWSNWVNLPDWKRRGFYRLDSEKGQQILDRLNLSAREQLETTNTPLPFDDDPPYTSYREYLKHPRFLAIRAQVFERAAGACERCKSRPPTEPHHLRYPPWGTFDVPENMIAICHPCHCEIHGKAS